MSVLEDAIEPPDSPGMRLARLEWRYGVLSADFTLSKAQVEKLTAAHAADHQDLVNLGKDVASLTTKLDRLTWTIVLLTLTIAASAISLAISIASHG